MCVCSVAWHCFEDRLIIRVGDLTLHHGLPPTPKHFAIKTLMNGFYFKGEVIVRPHGFIVDGEPVTLWFSLPWIAEVLLEGTTRKHRAAVTRMP